MDLETFNSWVEIVQGILTSVGILVAGIWSFIVFVLGRSSAPNITASLRARSVVDSGVVKGIVVSVKIKNIGNTRVKKDNCYLSIWEVATSDRPNLGSVRRLDDSPELILGQAKVYSIFNDHTWLEPGEEATEDVLLTPGEHPILKASVTFFGKTFRKKKYWSSSAILDTRAVTAPPDSAQSQQPSLAIDRSGEDAI